MYRYILTLLISVTPFAQAQYIQVATANQAVTITGNITTIARYGSVVDNKWFYKAYTSKAFVVGNKEFTTNPDPSGDPSTFVLQVYQMPLASNFPPAVFIVAGKTVIVPPYTGGVTPPTPPIQSGQFVLTLNCTVTPTNIGCK